MTTQTLSQPSTHNTTPYTITLEKTKGGFYRCRARIDHAELTHQMDWQDGSGHVWVDGEPRALRQGETLQANPYEQARQQVEAMIDALDDLVAGRARMNEHMAKLPDTLRTKVMALAAKEQYLPLENILNDPAIAQDVRRVIRLNQLKEENKMAIKPKTEATEKNLADMRAETTRLMDAFGGAAGVSFVCREHYKDTEHSDKFRRGTVSQWNNRGRISAEAANLMGAVPQLKAAGFSRESLRPDVTFWYVD